jgi:hypothetical protein
MSTKMSRSMKCWSCFVLNFRPEAAARNAIGGIIQTIGLPRAIRELWARNEFPDISGKDI